MDSDEQDEPVSKPAASTDSETSDSDDEVWSFSVTQGGLTFLGVQSGFSWVKNGLLLW